MVEEEVAAPEAAEDAGISKNSDTLGTLFLRSILLTSPYKTRKSGRRGRQNADAKCVESYAPENKEGLANEGEEGRNHASRSRSEQEKAREGISGTQKAQSYRGTTESRRENEAALLWTIAYLADPDR